MKAEPNLRVADIVANKFNESKHRIISCAIALYTETDKNTTYIHTKITNITEVDDM